ncbi:MAG: hypothetical protein QOH29_240 [Actinomycetota bacterium]|nr:hypothetical protein [Actinomycetota bacterium]
MATLVGPGPKLVLPVIARGSPAAGLVVESLGDCRFCPAWHGADRTVSCGRLSGSPTFTAPPPYRGNVMGRQLARRALALLSIVVMSAALSTVGAPGAGAAPWSLPTCFASDGTTPIPTLVGTGGNDVLIGTPGDDVILGLAGNDLIIAGGGDDVVCGSQGRDRILGGPGRDVLDGADVDLVDAADAGQPTGDGADWIFGGPGDDDIFGLTGGDVEDGGPGADLVQGEFGADLLFGGPGDDDMVLGYSAHDVTGADHAFGGPGDDLLLGSGDRDRLDAGAGNDFLDGADGSDLLLAGPGDDVVAPYLDDSGDVLENGDDHILGGPGDDRLDGGPGRDRIDGQQGSDTCTNAELTRNCESLSATALRARAIASEIQQALGGGYVPHRKLSGRGHGQHAG